MSTSPSPIRRSAHGRVVGNGACQSCLTAGLRWVVRDDVHQPPLLVDPRGDAPHRDVCTHSVRPSPAAAPSEAEALHAAHVLRDHIKAQRPRLEGTARWAADELYIAAVRWVANLPPGDAACPICRLVFRDGKR